MNINQKEEFRYLYAGMALQGIIQGCLTNDPKSAKVISDEDTIKAFATLSKRFANALVDELEKG